MEENKMNYDSASPEETWNSDATPQWVRDMRKWHEEDPFRRHAFCTYSGPEDGGTTIVGVTIPILYNLTRSDENIGKLLDAAQTARKDILGRLKVFESFKEYRREHGYPEPDDDGDKDKEGGIRSALKDLLKTLSEKL